MDYKIIYGLKAGATRQEQVLDEVKMLEMKVAHDDREEEKVEKNRERKRIYDPQPYKEKKYYTGELISHPLETIEDKVKEAIAEGWKPYGSPQIVMEPDNRNHSIMQAMTKE
jgi:hypothetical protein